MYRPRAGSTDTTTHFWWVVVHDWARSLLYCKLYRRKILHSIPLKVMVPTLPPSTFQIKSAALKKKKKNQKPNVELCVRWSAQNWCLSFCLTALTEHQLQLTCFEKPKLPYPLRRYLLTQHCGTWRGCRWLTHDRCSRETTKLDIYPN